MIRFTKLVAPFGFAIITLFAFTGEAQAGPYSSTPCNECGQILGAKQRVACLNECAKPQKAEEKKTGGKKTGGKKTGGKKTGGNDKCEAGTENCPCFPNDTCNDPLECVQKGDEKICLAPCVEPQVRDESGNCSEPKCEPAPRNICDRDVAHKDLEDRAYRIEIAVNGDPDNEKDKGLAGKVTDLDSKVGDLNTTVTTGFGGANRYWWMHFVNAGLILLGIVLMLVRTRRKEDDEPQPPEGEKASSGGGQGGGGQQLPTPPGQTPQAPAAPAPQTPPAQGQPQNMPPLPQAGSAAPEEQPAPSAQGAPSHVPSPAPPPSQPPAAPGPGADPDGETAPAKGTMVGIPTGPSLN